MLICINRYISSYLFFFFSSRRRHTRFDCDWSSDVCSSDLPCCATPGRRKSTTTAWPFSRSCPLVSAWPTSPDRKSTRLNSSHSQISYAVFCLKKKKKKSDRTPYITCQSHTRQLMNTKYQLF